MEGAAGAGGRWDSRAAATASRFTVPTAKPGQRPCGPGTGPGPGRQNQTWSPVVRHKCTDGSCTSARTWGMTPCRPVCWLYPPAPAPALVLGADVLLSAGGALAGVPLGSSGLVAGGGERLAMAMAAAAVLSSQGPLPVTSEKALPGTNLHDDSWPLDGLPMSARFMTPSRSLITQQHH